MRVLLPGPSRQASSGCRIVVLAKAPVAGRVKTRLAATIGPQAAAALARRLLDHALRQALAADVGPVRLCGDPDPHDPAFGPWASDARLEHRPQAAGDLGRRMACALAAAALDRQRQAPGVGDAPDRPAAVLLMGSDAPALDAARLRAAAAALAAHPVVLVPAWDGGYALVGVRGAALTAGSGPALLSTLFDGVPWSSPRTMAVTRERLAAAGWPWDELESVGDIDTAEDLARGLPDGV